MTNRSKTNIKDKYFIYRYPYYDVKIEVPKKPYFIDANSILLLFKYGCYKNNYDTLKKFIIFLKNKIHESQYENLNKQIWFEQNNKGNDAADPQNSDSRDNYEVINNQIKYFCTIDQIIEPFQKALFNIIHLTIMNSAKYTNIATVNIVD